MDNESIKILISVEHSLYCDNLKLNLSKEFNKKSMIITVNSSQKLLKHLSKEVFQFLLIRIDRTVSRPIEFLSKIHFNFPSLKIIVLSFWDNQTYKEMLTKAGAFAFYQMDTDIESLIEKMEVKYETK